MKVVLDANVLLAGVFTRGVCERLLDLCWGDEPGIIIVCSEHILSEVADSARTKFGVPAEVVADAIDRMRHRMEVVEPHEVARDACRDADELPVLGTVKAGSTDYLVTGDRDLLVLKAFHGAPILSPREFYDLIVATG